MESDYGEFTLEEQEIINELLANITSDKAIPDEPFELTDIEDYEDPKSVRLPKTRGKESWIPPWMQSRGEQQPQGREAARGIREDQTPHNISTATNIDSAAKDKGIQRARARSASIEPQSDLSPRPNTRSPIERFRTKPKKALSVTDLVSPAWCELQYFYNLSKHGKKRATPAMKRGTKMHKKLENEVYTTVPVAIITKEDSWGLRIWNIVQGLRTLRETGKTRELEVWGLIDGEVVNGVIDELSYECPDPTFADEQAERPIQGPEGKDRLPHDQSSITDYLRSSAGGNGKTFGQLGNGIESSMEPRSGPRHVGKKKESSQGNKKIYITDIKTRSVKSLPSALAARPTEIQLQLYHSMLTALAQGKVPISSFAERYDFDPTVPFSDSFIAQVGSLNEQFFDTVSSQSQQGGDDAGGNREGDHPASSQDSIDILLQHNNIQSLWNFMIDQLQETILVDPPPSSRSSSSSPPPTSPPQHTIISSSNLAANLSTHLSPLLTATYIHASTQTNLGHKSFVHTPSALSAYLSDTMAWWRGERKARGVDVGEVNAKCTRCEFLADCEWIRERERAVRESKVREKIGE